MGVMKRFRMTLDFEVRKAKIEFLIEHESANKKPEWRNWQTR
jgi:hypothetical protein